MKLFLVAPLLLTYAASSFAGTVLTCEGYDEGNSVEYHSASTRPCVGICTGAPDQSRLQYKKRVLIGANGETKFEVSEASRAEIAENPEKQTILYRENRVANLDAEGAPEAAGGETTYLRIRFFRVRASSPILPTGSFELECNEEVSGPTFESVKIVR
jgi:hypothetical protein